PQDPEPRSPRAHVVDAVDATDVRVLALERCQEPDVASLLGRLVPIDGAKHGRSAAAGDVSLPHRPLLDRERIQRVEDPQVSAGDHGAGVHTGGDATEFNAGDTRGSTGSRPDGPQLATSDLAEPQGAAAAPRGHALRLPAGGWDRELSHHSLEGDLSELADVELRE